MKILYNIKLIGLLFLLILGSCDKTSFDGTLVVSFHNHSSDLKVSIYSINNDKVPIKIIAPDSKGILKLNLIIGNYILQPNSESKYYPNIGFQINQDKTTTLIYDENNNCELN